MRASASIVLYNNPPDEISELIKLILSSSIIMELFLIDNSDSPNLMQLESLSERIKYKFLDENLGFGRAHNQAFDLAIQNGMDYHFVINPDVKFESKVIESMVRFMEDHENTAMLMPKIVNLDGTNQNLPKLLPSPFSLIRRKLKWPRYFHEKFLNLYELRFVGDSFAYSVPVLSGCFTLFRLSAIKAVGGYDDKFFMYFEDWDLSRRMHRKYKTIYYPKVQVIHGYESGANKNYRLLKVFVKSAIIYFNKWGWFFDQERNSINKKALQQFNEEILKGRS